jgi:chemotaxis protein methyltransferase CheR
MTTSILALAERLQLAEVIGITDAEFDRLRSLIHTETGIELRDTKRHLLCARLARRLRHHGYATFGEYWTHLRDHDPAGAERTAMINAITTTKTDFFREPHHFDFLREQVLPDVAARIARGDTPRLRIWSAGCSTGEEPYSIAFTVLDARVGTSSWDARILASDINTDVLAAAEEGVYAHERLDGVDANVTRRHFRPLPDEPARFQVNPLARRLVAFRQINLQDGVWPIRTTFDVIFCRNVIIYFDRATQREVVRRLAAFLEPGGYLVLGHSESLLGHGLGLSYVGQTVYRKLPAGSTPPSTDIHA